MANPTRLVIQPFLQEWDGSSIKVRLLLLPVGSPLTPLVGNSGPSFPTANFKFDVHILPTDRLPEPSGSIFTTVNSAALTKSRQIFEAVAKEIEIDPNPRRANRQANTRVLKHLPQTYQDAVSYGSGRSNLVFTDDTYRCMLRRTPAVPKYTKLPAWNSKVPWGRVISWMLRDTRLGLAAGLIRTVQVPIPKPETVREGGYIYFTLSTGSDGSGLSTVKDGLKVYATRFPDLAPKVKKPLFTPVLLPVVDPVPDHDYVDIFSEIQDYGDGWAKAIHCSQQTQLNPLAESSASPVGRPVKETGIRLGWDDEQVTIWLNRQLDTSLPAYDAPLGVAGYRVDVRLAGSQNWSSLMRATGHLKVGSVDISSNEVELAVSVNPINHEAKSQGDFWLPIYFATWHGAALGTPDLTRHGLSGGVSPVTPTISGIQPTTSLRYGQSYEFRVRFADLTGGGRPATDILTASGPAVVAKIDFKRYIAPLAPRLVSKLPYTPDPSASLRVKRPLLQYPAVNCTGSYGDNVNALLLQDVVRAKEEGREPGLPDPDVDRLGIELEARCFSQDPEATNPSFIPVYKTTRLFPSNVLDDSELVIPLVWEDCADVRELRRREEKDAKLTGPLTVPTARSLRMRLYAIGKEDAHLTYFGADDIRTGPSVAVELRRESVAEPDLFAPETPSSFVNGFFLQPDTPATSLSRHEPAAPSTIARLATALDLRLDGNTLRARFGRLVFGCAASLRHIIGPDAASLTFSSSADLALRWLNVLRFKVNRDWTWDGLEHQGFEILYSPNGQDDAEVVGHAVLPRNISEDAFAEDVTGARQVGDVCAYTDVIFIHSVNPRSTDKPPQPLKATYTVTPLLRAKGRGTSSTTTIDLPATTPPQQTPKLLSAGIAMSPYLRSPDYSATTPRQKLLWLEFASPVAQAGDTIFARALRNVPDPTLCTFGRVPELAPLPALPLPPESIRRIVPCQSRDLAGYTAMTALIPAADSATHFALPLPTGDPDSAALLGFWTYEFRVGHGRDLWSTAAGRFGPALVVDGIQHPPPALRCVANRPAAGVLASAAHAVPVYQGRVGTGAPRTTMWFMLYTQAKQMDGEDYTNVLVLRRKGDLISTGTGAEGGPENVDRWSSALFPEQYVLQGLRELGFSKYARLSVLAVELRPMQVEEDVRDPLGADLGRQRILRTSTLIPVPTRCYDS